MYPQLGDFDGGEFTPAVASAGVLRGDFFESGMLGALVFAVRAAVLETATDGKIGETGDHALDDRKFRFARGAEARDRGK